MPRLGIWEWLIICIPIPIVAGIVAVIVVRVWPSIRKGRGTDNTQSRTEWTEGTGDHSLMPLLETAASTIAGRPDPQTVRWVTYLLQALDEKLGMEVGRQMLENVRDAINARLEAGKW